MSIRALALKPSAVLISAAILGLPLAHANDVEQNQKIVIKGEQEPGNLVLNDLEIERTQATDLNDLFANESSMSVGGGSKVAQKFYVRGLEDALLNVTIDGAAQPGMLYHHQTRVQIEPEFIKTIQLDAGAGAATNGPGAITGAMHVTTKNAFDMLREGQDAGAFIKGQAVFNGEDEFKALASVYGRVNNNIGLLASIVRHDGEDYEDGEGNLASPTAFDHERALIKLNGEFEDHEFSVAYEDLHDFGNYYERPHFSGWSSRYRLTKHEMNRESFTYNHRYDPDSENVDVKFSAYHNTSDYSNYHLDDGGLYGRGELQSTGFDVRNTTLLNNHSVTYGIDYRKDELDSASDVRPGLGGANTETAKVFGLYAQDNWQLSDKLMLSYGLRYDAYDHKVESGDGAGANSDTDGFSPNISIEWEIADGLTLRPAYAMAHRGPRIKEAFFSTLYEHRGGLEAEEADNLEFGIAYEKDDFFARATFYKQNIDNYISSVWVGDDTWGYWDNVGDMDVEGYEIEVGKEWHDLRLSLGVWEANPDFNGVALSDADLGQGTSIGRTWIAKADFMMPEHNLDLAFVARHVESEPNLASPGLPDKEAYTIADIHASWKPLNNEQLTLSLAIDNIFDEFYYDHATYTAINRGEIFYAGFPARGRSVLLGASYKF